MKKDMRYSFKQVGRARVVLRRLRHAFEVGGLRGVGHTVAILRIEQRVLRLQAAVEREREVHSDQIGQLNAALNAQIGRQHQARIVAVTWALGRFARGERRGLLRAGR